MLSEEIIQKHLEALRECLFSLSPMQSIEENLLVISRALNMIFKLLSIPNFPRNEIESAARCFITALKFHLSWMEEHHKKELSLLADRLECAEDVDHRNGVSLRGIFGHSSPANTTMLTQAYVNSAEIEDVYQFAVDESVRLATRIEQGTPHEVAESNKLIAKRLAVIIIYLKKKFKGQLKEASRKSRLRRVSKRGSG
jgi:hypothetical protein